MHNIQAASRNNNIIVTNIDIDIIPVSEYVYYSVNKQSKYQTLVLLPRGL